MPIQMTREEYIAKYGKSPDFSTAKPSSAPASNGIGASISQAFQGGVNQAKEGYQQAYDSRKTINPLQLVEGSTKMLAGGINAAFSPLAPVMKPLEAGMNKSINEISSYPAVQKFAQTGAGQGTARVAEDVGNLSTIAGAEAGFMGAPKVGGVISDGTKTITSGIDQTAEALKSTANGFANPENIMQRVARIPKGAQAGFEKTAGESVGSYLNKRNIYGSTEEISQQLYKRFDESKKAADTSLAKLKGEYRPLPLKSALEDLIGREKRVSAAGARSPDYTRVVELANKYKKNGLNMTEINEVKRMFERNVRLDFVKQNLPEGVARVTNIDNALREWQFGQAKKLGLKNLPEINKETKLSKTLLDAIGKESSGSAGNNAISLSDTIMLASGDPTVIGAYITKKILGLEKVQSYAAKKLYRGEKIGKPNADFGSPKPGLEEFMNKKP